MSWKGKKVAVTGKFSGMNRADVEAMVRNAGATVMPSVNSKTDLLITGNGTDNGSKQANAAKFSIPTTSLSDARNAMATGSWPYTIKVVAPTKQQTKEKERAAAKVKKEMDASLNAVDKSSDMPWFVGF